MVKITFSCYEKYVHVTILYLLIIVIVILVILNVFHTHRETDKFKIFFCSANDNDTKKLKIAARL